MRIWLQHCGQSWDHEPWPSLLKLQLLLVLSAPQWEQQQSICLLLRPMVAKLASQEVTMTLYVHESPASYLVQR